MKCPACGVLGLSRVTKTTETAPFNQRWRECLCGAEWMTQEHSVKGTLKAISRPSAEHIRTSNGLPATRVLSLLSGSDPVCSDPNPQTQSNPDQERAPVKATRRKKKTLEYPQVFEAFWSVCDSNRSKGMKGEALEAWIAAGSPDCVMLADKWRAYRRANGDTLCKDVCRWIKWGGHLQDYAAAPVAPARDTRPQWQREKEDQGARERQASARYHEKEAEKPVLCGFHFYRGEDKRFTPEDACRPKCPWHGKDAYGDAI